MHIPTCIQTQATQNRQRSQDSWKPGFIGPEASVIKQTAQGGKLWTSLFHLSLRIYIYDNYEKWFQGTFGFISLESFSFETSPAGGAWWFCPGCISSYKHCVNSETVCVEKETSTHIAAHIPLTYFLKLNLLGSSSSSTSKHGVAATVLGTGLVSNGSWPYTNIHIGTTFFRLSLAFVFKHVRTKGYILLVYPACLRGICECQSVRSRSSLQLTSISTTLLTSLLDVPAGSKSTLSDSKGTCKPTNKPFRNSWEFWNQGKPIHTQTNTHHIQKQDPAEPFSPASWLECPATVPQ